MADKATVLLEHHLKQLKLPTVLREYAKVAQVCQAERVDYQTYLLRLVEQELLDREQRAKERRIKAAGFPIIKTLDSFDFKAQPSIINTVFAWDAAPGFVPASRGFASSCRRSASPRVS